MRDANDNRFIRQLMYSAVPVRRPDHRYCRNSHIKPDGSRPRYNSPGLIYRSPALRLPCPLHSDRERDCSRSCHRADHLSCRSHRPFRSLKNRCDTWDQNILHYRESLPVYREQGYLYQQDRGTGSGNSNSRIHYNKIHCGDRAETCQGSHPAHTRGRSKSNRFRYRQHPCLRDRWQKHWFRNQSHIWNLPG